MDKSKAFNALIAIAELIRESIEAAGPKGMPAGHLYAHLMVTGCDLQTFEALIGTLVRTGRVERDGDLLRAVSR